MPSNFNRALHYTRGNLNNTHYKGRGSSDNANSRFDQLTHEKIDDGWGTCDEPIPPLKTVVEIDNSHTIIAKNKSPDLPFDRSINMYRGCEHGCSYCFARPTHAYLGLSPGLDFESRLLVKPNAAKLLRAELAKNNYRCKPIALGTNTDPYQPIERDWQITRKILTVLDTCSHPVSIVSKGSMIERDLDLLARMAQRNLVEVMVSITTLDRSLARRMEPRASVPQRRLQTIARLRNHGVPVGVMVAPIIPILTDSEIERILQQAAETGATFAGHVLLRLPLEVGPLFSQWLDEHYPQKAKHVLNIIRMTRGGKINDPTFGRRFSGQGEYAELINQRYHLQCKKLGLNSSREPLRTDLFESPTPVDAPKQLSLF